MTICAGNAEAMGLIMYESSGWDRLTDGELSSWHIKNGGAAQMVGVMSKRGITIKECVVCDQERMHHDHDYQCIECRNM